MIFVRSALGLALAAIMSIAGACMTDAKNVTCTFDVMLVSGEELYCPDKNAPDDCEALNEAIVDAAVVCGAGTFREDELRAALDEDGALQRCDDARATSVRYEECLAHFANSEEPPCEGASLGPVPEACVGVILQGPA